jgi:hypothetical protein
MSALRTPEPVTSKAVESKRSRLLSGLVAEPKRWN